MKTKTNEQITMSVDNLVIKLLASIDYLINDLDNFKSYLKEQNENELLKNYFELELETIKLNSSSLCEASQSVINLLDLIDKLIIEDEDNIKDETISPLKYNFQSFIDLQSLYFNICYYSEDKDCDSCNYLDDNFETMLKELVVKDFEMIKTLFSK